MAPRRLPHLPVALLAVLLAWSALLHAVYLTYDGRTFPAHDAFYLRTFAVAQDRAALNGTALPVLIADAFEQSPYALTDTILLVVDKVRDLDQTTFTALKFLWYALMIVGSYALGNAVGGRWVGLVSAVACAGMPVFVDQSRKLFPHLAASSIAIWMHVAVVRARASGWTAWHALGLAVAAALGVLVHPVAIVLSVPAYLALSAMLALDRKRRPVSHRVGLAALGVSLPVLLQLARIGGFARYLGEKTMHTRRFLWQSESTDVIRAELARWWTYGPPALAGEPFLVLAAIGFAGLVVVAIVRRSVRFETGYLLATVVFYLGCSVHFFYTDGLQHDFLLLYALIAPLVGSGLAQALAPPPRRTAIGFYVLLAAAAVAVAVAGQIDGVSLAPESRRSHQHQDDCLHVQPVPSLHGRVARAIRDEARGRRIVVREFDARPCAGGACDDGAFDVEKHELPFRVMESLLRMEHVGLARADEAQARRLKVSVYYLPIESDETIREIARRGRRFAQTLPPGADALDWSIAARPECRPVCAGDGTLALVVRRDGSARQSRDE